MPDTIGYVTLEQADEYVATHYITVDKLREAWEALGDDDREALLLKSFETIEQLPFAGKKTFKDQPNAFPRSPSLEVPKQVQWAQIENALSASDTSTAEEAEHYGRLWQFGVQSYTIGNLSEKISEGAWSSGSTSAVASGLVSNVATRLLKPFLNGSYRVTGGFCR